MAARYATEAEIYGASGIAPELATYAAANPGNTTAIVDLAKRFLGLTAWGDDASFGHALVAAHFLTLQSAGAMAVDGSTTSIADGPASRSFAVPAPTAEDAEFAGTQYGRRFIAMRRAVIAAAGPVLARGTVSDAFFGGGRWPR